MYRQEVEKRIKRNVRVIESNMRVIRTELERRAAVKKNIVKGYGK